MAYFDNVKKEIVLEEKDKEVFKECQVFVQTPPEKRPKLEMAKMLNLV